MLGVNGFGWGHIESFVTMLIEIDYHIKFVNGNLWIMTRSLTISLLWYLTWQHLRILTPQIVATF